MGISQIYYTYILDLILLNMIEKIFETFNIDEIYIF